MCKKSGHWLLLFVDKFRKIRSVKINFVPCLLVIDSPPLILLLIVYILLRLILGGFPKSKDKRLNDKRLRAKMRDWKPSSSGSFALFSPAFVAAKKWTLMFRFQFKTRWRDSKLGKCWPHYEMKVISGPWYDKINFRPSGTWKIYFLCAWWMKINFLISRSGNDFHSIMGPRLAQLWVKASGFELKSEH